MNKGKILIRILLYLLIAFIVGYIIFVFKYV